MTVQQHELKVLNTLEMRKRSGARSIAFWAKQILELYWVLILWLCEGPHMFNVLHHQPQTAKIAHVEVCPNTLK